MYVSAAAKSCEVASAVRMLSALERRSDVMKEETEEMDELQEASLLTGDGGGEEGM